MFHLLLTVFLFFSFFASSLNGQQANDEPCGLLKDRIAGAFLGAAIGDALGRIPEFIPTVLEIKKRFGPEGVTHFTKEMELYNQYRDISLVPYTDDTVMALDLAKVLLDGRQANASVQTMMDTLARSYARLLGKNRYAVDPLFNIRAHGIQNIKACSSLERYIEFGLPIKNSLWWCHCSTLDTYNAAFSSEGGCGSAMRAWPIGIIFADNIALVKELADKQSWLTHRHPMARAASVAIAVGVSQALLQKSPDEVAQAMIQSAQAFDDVELLYKKNAQKLPEEARFSATMVAQDQLLTSDMLRYAVAMAKEGKVPEEVLGLTNDKQMNFRSARGALLGWPADEAAAAALYIFMRHSDDLKSALLEGANTPGDSDSIASLAGALVGARTGIQLLNYCDFDYSLLENCAQIRTLAKSIHDILGVNLVKKGICA